MSMYEPCPKGGVRNATEQAVWKPTSRKAKSAGRGISALLAVHLRVLLSASSNSLAQLPQVRVDSIAREPRVSAELIPTNLYDLLPAIEIYLLVEIILAELI